MSGTKNILVITYWGFNSPILHSYALPYIKQIKNVLPAGSKVFLVTLTPSFENYKGEYTRQKSLLEKENIFLLDYAYKPFGWQMLFRFPFIFLSILCSMIGKNIRSLHAWCTPGGAIAYILSVLTCKPLILDSFEPHAESMVETGTWKKESFAYRLLFRLEKLQLKRAKHVICAADGMIAYSQKTYGIIKSSYFVKPACVDLQLFRKQEKNDKLVPEVQPGSIVCVYAGKFGGIYLEQEVFDFFKTAHSHWGNKFRVLLLTNHSQEEISAFCKTSGLNPGVVTHRFVKHENVPAYMSLGDFGICPVKPVPTKEFCTPIKNGEYWAMGLPVVITKNISSDSQLIATENIGYVLNDLSIGEYLQAVKKISVLLEDKSLAAKIRAIAERERNYTMAETIYRKIYA